MESYKVLDKMGKKQNVYELILKLAKRGHELMSGVPSEVKSDSLNMAFVPLKEVIADKLKIE